MVHRKQLSNEQQQEIRDMYATGQYSQRRLADLNDVSVHQVRLILQGVAKLVPSLAERFWSKVDIRTVDECWEWQATRDRYGYGRFRYGSRKVKAHRVAYELSGRQLGRWIVRHTCDNPVCCNPNHLVRGSRRDNAQDRVKRGRGPARYTTEQKLEACVYHDLGYKRWDIGRMLGIKCAAVVRIVRGDRFKYVDEWRRQNSVGS